MRGFRKGLQEVAKKLNRVAGKLFSSNKQTQHVGKEGVGIQVAGSIDGVDTVIFDHHGTLLKSNVNIATCGSKTHGMIIKEDVTIISGMVVSIRGVRVSDKNGCSVELRGDDLIIYADNPTIVYDETRPACLNITIKPAKE